MSPRFERRPDRRSGSGGKGPARPSRPAGDRFGADRAGGDRFGAERSPGERPSGDRFSGERFSGERAGGDRPGAARPAADRTGGERRFQGRREDGGRGERRGDPRSSSSGERSFARRPGSPRPGIPRPGISRAGAPRPSADRSFRDRPAADRFADKPQRERSFGDRPFSDRSGAPRREGAPQRDGDRRQPRTGLPRTGMPRTGLPGTLARRDWGDRPGRAPLAVDPTRESAQGDSERFGAEASSDLIWGRHSSLAVLESGRPIHRIWCTTEMRFTPNFLQLLRDAKSSGVLVEEVTWARLGQISGGAVHQGIVLQTAAAETLDLPTLIDGCRGLGESPLLLAVDGLTDPHNLGAIVRSAEALGAHGLVLPQRRNAGLTGTVAKVAAGALENLPVARVVNLNRSLDALKQEGYRVVGLAAEGNHTLEEADLDGPLVIVTGSESEGLSLLTRRSCDQLVRIPLRGVTPSLNASVATALLVYEIARRGWMKGITGSQPAPRISRPQLAQPARPETATPEPEANPVVGEDLAAPQASAGQLDALAFDSPEEPQPASFNPEAATPEPATPEAATPKAATPKAATAEAATPKAATPKAATPEAATPKAVTPKAATAETGTADSEARDPGPQQALAAGSGEPLPAAEAPAVASGQAIGQTAVANGQTAVPTGQTAGANGPTAGAEQQTVAAAGKTAAEPDLECLPASAAAAGAATLGSQGPAASAPQPLALGLQPRLATGFDGDIQL